ncbi:MAG TPA: hypothetical protein VFE58_06855 [Tepidisphaeraceae bacterium]|jgi:hypothetical protein|nr:hypothetical protein [Tepidisphaeraceae bacterium]
MKKAHTRAFLALVGLCGSSAYAQTVINFNNLLWPDYGGTNAHVLKTTNADLIDAQSRTVIPFAGPSPTDDNGNIQFATNYSTVDAGGNIEAQLQLVDSIPGIATAYGSTAAGANPLQITLPAVYLVPPNQVSTYNNVSFTSATDNPDAAKMFEVLQFVKFMHDYYGNVATFNATLPAIRINYLSTNTGSSMGGGVMKLGYTDWGNIDVILHEYGHHVAENNNIEAAGLGLDHTFNSDSIGNLYNPDPVHSIGNKGKLPGSQLAWQEGIATYLAQVAIADGNLNAAISNLPADSRNFAYDSYTPAPNATTVSATDFSYSVSINTLDLQLGAFVEPDPEADNPPAVAGNPPFQSRGGGEGDEMSVMRTLWDFENNTNVEGYARAGQGDASHFGSQKIFSLMKGVAAATKGTFYGFWQSINADVRTPADKPLVGLAAADPDAKAVALLGSTLEQNDISSIPMTLGAQLTTKPTIQWTEENADNSTKFEVLIYSSDWKTLILQSPQINDQNPGVLNGIGSYTLTTDLDPGTYEYVILNSPATATAADLNSIYNWYWSGDALISVPEPTCLAISLVTFTLLTRRKRA